MDFVNSLILWGVCALVIIMVIAQSLVFMRKAWSHGKAIGIETADMKKALRNGLVVSIIPALAVLVPLIAIVPIIGRPVPWLRFSIIGSAMYESMAANMGIVAGGGAFLPGGFDAKAFSSAIWIMTTGAGSIMLYTLLCVKPLSNAIDRLRGKGMAVVTLLASCSLAGVMGSICAGQAASAPGAWIIFGSCFVLGSILHKIGRTSERFRILKELTLPLGIIFGMVLAVIIL